MDFLLNQEEEEMYDNVDPNFYVSTFQKPTTANVCVSGHLISEDDINLVVGKINCIEVYRIHFEDLQLLKEIWLYEKIEIMKVFPSKNKDKDLIFILTSKYNAMILECIRINKHNDIEIITRAQGNICTKSLVKTGFLCSVNLDSRIIGLQLFEQLLNVLSMDQEGCIVIHPIKIKEKQIGAFEFLHGCTKPTIMIIELGIDLKKRKLGLIKVKELSSDFKTLIDVTEKKERTSQSARTIISIPKPPFGAIIMDNLSIVYHNGSCVTKKYPNQTICNVKCYASPTIKFNGTKYLLGDQDGHLFKLYLKYGFGSDGKPDIPKIHTILLGEISIPSSLSYINKYLVFVASQFGDSQLIKYVKEPYVFNNTSILQMRVLKTYINLGPIIDMCMADTEERGQNDIFTCSGAFKHGSIKKISSGIRLHALASIDLVGIKGLWSLNLNGYYDENNALLLTFIEHSKVLSFKHEEVEEIYFEGFQTELQTLYCGNTTNNKIIQITSVSVRLICCMTEKLISEWIPPACKRIDVAACNSDHVVCAIANCLYYLEIGSEQIFQIGDTELKQEISCLDIYSFKNQSKKSISFVAVGLWVDICIKLFQLPHFVETDSIFLNEIFVPRSLSLITLESTDYLFCSLANGTLYSYSFLSKNGTLCEINKIQPCNQPALLRKFQSHYTTSLCVCLDKNPIIINSSSEKLIFSNININKVHNLCTLNTKEYQNSLALATDTSIIIATVGKEKTLNVYTIPLGESPKGIAHQEASKSFGVITVKSKDGKNYSLKSTQFNARTTAKKTSNAIQNFTQTCDTHLKILCEKDLKLYLANKYHYLPDDIDYNVNHMIILHQNTFEVLHAYQLYDHEYALHIISAKLENDSATYYILGTGFNVAKNNQLGRIVIFHFDNSSSSLKQVDEKQLKGSCNSLVVTKGKLLVAFKNSVQLLGWNSLYLYYGHSYVSHNSVVQYLKPKQCYKHFGDSHLFYRGQCYSLVKDETNLNIRQSSSIQIIKRNYFILTDGSQIHTFKKNKHYIGSNNETILLNMFNLGDGITVFQHGSLVKEMFIHTHNSLVSTEGNIFFGTYSGALGIITQTNPEVVDFLYDLQKTLSRPIEELDKHTNWLSYITIRNTDIQGYLDGNLIENFLNLPRTKMCSIIRELKKSYDRKFQPISTETEIDVEHLIKFVKQLTHLPLDS